jgi:hypothetical protein
MKILADITVPESVGDLGKLASLPIPVSLVFHAEQE